MKSFKPIGPRGKALAAMLDGRAEPRVPGKTRAVLYIDTDAAGRMRLDAPTQEVPWQHGRYTNARGEAVVAYYRFYVRGVPFERRCVSEASGNFAVTFATVGGVRYLLLGAPWPG